MVVEATRYGVFKNGVLLAVGRNGEQSEPALTFKRGETFEVRSYLEDVPKVKQKRAKQRWGR